MTDTKINSVALAQRYLRHMMLRCDQLTDLYLSRRGNNVCQPLFIVRLPIETNYGHLPWTSLQYFGSMLGLSEIGHNLDAV